MKKKEEESKEAATTATAVPPAAARASAAPPRVFGLHKEKDEIHATESKDTHTHSSSSSSSSTTPPPRSLQQTYDHLAKRAPLPVNPKIIRPVSKKKGSAWANKDEKKEEERVGVVIGGEGGVKKEYEKEAWSFGKLLFGEKANKKVEGESGGRRGGMMRTEEEREARLWGSKVTVEEVEEEKKEEEGEEENVKEEVVSKEDEKEKDKEE